MLATHAAADLATLATAVGSLEEFLDPNAVKVVTDAQGRALYFSRAPLPWDRDGAAARPAQMSFAGARRHIGIYAYRVAALHRLTMLPPSPLERRERLEQLRALEHGFHIQVGEASEAPGPDVNTPEDLLRVGRLIGV
jgi:3-deoxy-manno-octulosonate cytidylyltransferase (CMP-KDO synthetase)